MAKRKSNQEKEIEIHWQLCIKIFFDFYQQNFSGEKPSFDGSAPRDLKNIALALKKRAEEKNIEWTPEVAQTRLVAFLEYAYSDVWIRENFMLHILNRKKDAIFVKIAQSKNNQNGQSGNSQGSGTQGRVDALRKW